MTPDSRLNVYALSKETSEGNAAFRNAHLDSDNHNSLVDLSAFHPVQLVRTLNVVAHLDYTNASICGLLCWQRGQHRTNQREQHQKVKLREAPRRNIEDIAQTVVGEEGQSQWRFPARRLGFNTNLSPSRRSDAGCSRPSTSRTAEDTSPNGLFPPSLTLQEMMRGTFHFFPIPSLSCRQHVSVAPSAGPPRPPPAVACPPRSSTGPWHPQTPKTKTVLYTWAFEERGVACRLSR